MLSLDLKLGNVLLDFAGRHQAEVNTEEDLHFTQTYRAPEG